MKHYVEFNANRNKDFRCNDNIIDDPVEMCSMAKNFYETKFTDHLPDSSRTERKAYDLDFKLEDDSNANLPQQFTSTYQNLKALHRIT